MRMETGAFIVDVMILIWLIGSWLYEGHHKHCKVEVTCAHCGHASETACKADHRPAEKEAEETGWTH